ncbi:MAG: alpha/beta hydrolase-fold protein [Candidatus Cloacimonetes bacterium]|nr:alpha/beta hydrolase-fold protein [Candidatus Cloacimonadota bacterium]
MSRKKLFLMLILGLFLISTNVISIEIETAERLLNEDNQDILQRGYAAYSEENFAKALEYFFDYWQTQRDDYNALYFMALCYNQLNNPELAGRFFLEAKKRTRTQFSKENSERNFSNVWEEEAFQVYRDEVFEIIDSRERERGFMSYHEITSKIRYRTILPDDFDPEKEYPVMIFLHGHGGSPLNSSTLSEAFRENDIIFIMPQAPYPWEITIRRTTNFSWMIVDFDEGDYNDSHSIVLTQNYITSLNHSLREQYNVSSFYLSGFSQGGYQTLSIGLQNQDIFDALICFGGGLALPEFLIPENGEIPVLIVHGESDMVVTFETGVDAYERLKAMGYNIELFPFDGAHEMSHEIIEKAIEWMMFR